MFAFWQTDVLALWQTYNAIAQNQAVIESKLLICCPKKRPKGRMKAVLHYNQCVYSLANRCVALWQTDVFALWQTDVFALWQTDVFLDDQVWNERHERELMAQSSSAFQGTMLGGG
jgi:hypothetical protein